MRESGRDEAGPTLKDLYTLLDSAGIAASREGSHKLEKDSDWLAYQRLAVESVRDLILEIPDDIESHFRPVKTWEELKANLSASNIQQKMLNRCHGQPIAGRLWEGYENAIAEAVGNAIDAKIQARDAGSVGDGAPAR